MPEISAIKALLREATRRTTDTWPEEELRTSDAALFAALMEYPPLLAAKRILLFYGVGTEPRTAPLLPALWALGKEVYLPVCLPARQIEARLVEPDCLMAQSAFGIPEPAESCPAIARDALDFILVPALCYDRRGYRLGQGGGYYDRYLASYTGQTAGLCRARLLQERLPVESFDVPVPCIITEGGAITCE